MTLSLSPALCPSSVWFPPSVPLSTPPYDVLTFLNSTWPYQPACLSTLKLFLLRNLYSHPLTNYSLFTSPCFLSFPPQNLCARSFFFFIQVKLNYSGESREQIKIQHAFCRWCMLFPCVDLCVKVMCVMFLALLSQGLIQ